MPKYLETVALLEIVCLLISGFYFLINFFWSKFNSYWISHQKKYNKRHNRPYDEGIVYPDVSATQAVISGEFIVFVVSVSLLFACIVFFLSKSYINGFLSCSIYIVALFCSIIVCLIYPSKMTKRYKVLMCIALSISTCLFVIWLALRFLSIHEHCNYLDTLLYVFLLIAHFRLGYALLIKINNKYK